MMLFVLDYYKIGKVKEIKNNDITVSLFHYKLGVRSEQIINSDVIVSLGNVGAKSVFELTEQKQKLLINRIFDMCMSRRVVICRHSS